MFKKLLITLFVWILSLYSINYVNAEEINYSEKINPVTYSKLEDLSTKLVYLKLEKLNSVYYKIDDFLSKNDISEEKKYILLYLKEKVNVSIKEKTNKTAEELQIISDKLDKIDIKSLTKLSDKFDIIEEKYWNTPQSKELLNYLKNEIKKKITSKYLEENSKWCLYNNVLYPKWKIIDNTIVAEKKYKKWLECDENYEIVLHYNYFKWEENDDLTDSKNWQNNNIYKWDKAVEVYDNYNDVDSVSSIDDIPEVYLDDNNQEVVETGTWVLEDTDTWSLDVIDWYTEFTSEKCNDDFMTQYWDLTEEFVCRNPGKEEDGIDTLMNASQSICYLWESDYTLEEVLDNKHPIWAKLRIAKVECTRNWRISTWESTEEVTCSESEKKVASMHVSEWWEDWKPIYWCVSKETLTCLWDDINFIERSDENIISFCERHADEWAVLSSWDDLICSEWQIQVYPISAYESEWELSEEEKLGSCTEEWNVTCEKNWKFYMWNSEEETRAFCESCDWNIKEWDITDFYTNYLCDENTIFNNTLWESYICRAPLWTVNYTIMTDPELSCIDIDNEILQSEWENNTFSENEKKQQLTKLKTLDRVLLNYKKSRFEDFIKNTSGMSIKEKNAEREDLDSLIEEYYKKKIELESEMMLFNSYKLDSLWAKSVARLAVYRNTTSQKFKTNNSLENEVFWTLENEALWANNSLENEVFWTLEGEVFWTNTSYWSNLRCTTAGFFWDTEWFEEIEEEITVQTSERDWIDNYFQYLESSACWSDFVMKRKLTGWIIDSMEIEAGCKDKDELSYEEDVLKEIKEFWGTDILDWVVYIKVNEQSKDICDDPSPFLRTYCDSDTRKEDKAKREEDRQNNIKEWEDKINECATWQDAKTIKSCYIDNPHPDWQEVYAYKAIAALEYGIFEWDLVESDDFEVIEPASSLNKDWEPCDWNWEPCNADGTPLDESETDPESESWNHGGWQEGETYPPLEQNQWVPNLIWDDDIHTDPDGMWTLSLVLQMHKAKDINLLAVWISGTDTDNRKSVAVSAEAHYQGLKWLPIWMNQNKDKMRSWLSASSLTEKFPWTPYSESYTDIEQFSNDWCTNDLNINCGMRKEVVELYKEVLEKAEGKVTIATWGSNVNIYELLKSPGWKELIAEKVDKVIFIYRWQTRNGTIPYYTEAQHYLIDNLPVPFIEAFAFDLWAKYWNWNAIVWYQKIPYSRVWPLFKTYNKRSPTAFVYSRNRYYDGLTKWHSFMDAFWILYWVFWEEINGKRIIKDKVWVTFKKTEADNSIVNTPNWRHFKLTYNEDNVKVMYDYINEILKK